MVLPAPGGTEDTGTRDKDTAPVTIPATVKTIGTPDSTGALVVNLIVSPADGALLATKAAAKQIALVREPREGGS